MAWANLEPGFRALTERVCTEAEVEVLKRVADGAGYKTVARELGITREAERDRWRAADRKIRQEVGTRAERETPGCAMAMARRRAGGAEIGEVRHTRLDR
jgi:FixJ family two-component response regulator